MTEQPEPQQSDDRVLSVLKRAGFSAEEAQRSLNEAKLKIEAAALVGVAGFWS